MCDPLSAERPTADNRKKWRSSAPVRRSSCYADLLSDAEAAIESQVRATQGQSRGLLPEMDTAVDTGRSPAFRRRSTLHQVVTRSSGRAPSNAGLIPGGQPHPTFIAPLGAHPWRDDEGNAMNDSTDRRAEAPRVILVGNLGLNRRLESLLHRIEALDPPTGREAVKPLQATALAEFRVGDLLQRAIDSIDTLEQTAGRMGADEPLWPEAARAYDELRFAWPGIQGHMSGQAAVDTEAELAQVEVSIDAVEAQPTRQSEGALARAPLRALMNYHRKFAAAVQQRAARWLARGRAERIALAAQVREALGERAVPLSMSPDEVARVLVDGPTSAISKFRPPSRDGDEAIGATEPLPTTFILTAHVRAGSGSQNGPRVPERSHEKRS
jgi:hypothetical protein